MTRARLTLVLASALFALWGCADEYFDEDEGMVPLTEIPLERTREIPLREGFIDGKTVEFYRMGTFVPADSDWFPSYDKFPGMPVNEMFVWVSPEGELRLEQAQRPIIDRLPKEAGYSDFFEIVAVSAPVGYTPNDIKSRGTLLRAGYTTRRSGRVVNCPVVGPEASLGASRSPLLHPLVPLWHRGRTVHCLLLDGGTHLLSEKGAPAFTVSSGTVSSERSELRVVAKDLYTLVSRAFGGGDRVTNIPVPRNDIFRYARGSADYSPLGKLWNVTVPSDYQAGQIVSYGELFPIPDFTDPRIEAQSPEAFCNCPVVWVGN